MATPDDGTIAGPLIYQRGGRYDFNDGTWWSNYYQRWFQVDLNDCCFGEVEASDTGMKYGSSIFRSLLTMSGTYHKFSFQLFARGPTTTWLEAESPQFTVTCYTADTVNELDNLRSSDAGDARAALRELHGDVTYHGWVPQQETGFHWYSYTYLFPRIVY
ncbi:hypothetical protein [Streptomyces sp. NPDC002402]